MQETLDKVVKMQLSDGSQLELHMSPHFEDVIRARHGLRPDDEVSEELLKDFLLNTFSRAEVDDA